MGNIEAKFVREMLSSEGFRESLEGTCESCSKSRKECYDVVMSELENEIRQSDMAEFPPFRSHDYNSSEGSINATPVVSMKDKLIGLKSDLNNALDEVENLLETVG